MSVGSGLLFSILLLCRIVDIACILYGNNLISSNVCFDVYLGILNIISIFSWKWYVWLP